MGMIVPTGIATDNSTKDFFGDLVRQRVLVSLYDFENRDAIFQGVHRSYKFCLLTVSGEERRTAAAEFAFFLHNTAQLAHADSRFQMAAADFALFSPNTGNCPIFRTRRDMEINRKMYGRAGVLWQEAKPGRKEVNPWGVSFMQMFNMTTTSHLFRTLEQLEEDGWGLHGNIFERGDRRWLPLYEAKLFQQYDHRFATFEGVPASRRFQQNAVTIETGAEEKRDPHVVILPRYWVAEKEVEERLTPRRQPQATAAGDSRRRQRFARLAELARKSLSDRLPGRRTREADSLQ